MAYAASRAVLNQAAAQLGVREINIPYHVSCGSLDLRLLKMWHRSKYPGVGLFRRGDRIWPKCQNLVLPPFQSSHWPACPPWNSFIPPSPYPHPGWCNLLAEVQEAECSAGCPCAGLPDSEEGTNVLYSTFVTHVDWNKKFVLVQG